MKNANENNAFHEEKSKGKMFVYILYAWELFEGENVCLHFPSWKILDIDYFPKKMENFDLYECFDKLN